MGGQAVLPQYLRVSSWDELRAFTEAAILENFAANGWTDVTLNLTIGPPNGPATWDWSAYAPDGEFRTSDPSSPYYTPPITGWYASNQPTCPSGYSLNFGDITATCNLVNVNLQNCPTTVKPDKSRGACNKSANTSVGNPCNVATGNKYQVEVDYSSGGAVPLQYIRHYNSDTGTATTNLGPLWRSNFDRVLLFSSNELFSGIHYTSPEAFVYRPDGKVIAYELSTTTATPRDPDTTETLVQIDLLTWQLTTDDGAVETYKVSGNGQAATSANLTSITSREGVTQTVSYAANGLISVVTDSFGRSLSFGYDAQSRITTMTDPAGRVYTYSYNAAGYLSSVAYPDSTTHQYLYSDASNPGALTSIIDESGTVYATWTYDSMRRATSSQHSGGAEQVSFAYNNDGTTTVLDSLGSTSNYSFSVIESVPKATSITRSGASIATAFDTNGFLQSRTDRNGNQTTYTNNSRGLEISRTEAAGTSQARTVSTVWNSNFRVPATITEPTKATTFTYDSQGNLLTKTVTDTTTPSGLSRTWAYTYDNYGRVLTMDGPRTDITDVTTSAYYTCTTGNQCGQIQSVTNAMGQVTTFNTYNADGLPLTITHPNGIVTTLSYDLRRRVTSRQVGSETTSYSYYPTGLLQNITLPDGSFLQFTYDGAHRLTKISDGLNNSVNYTLDAMGNRTAETTYDSNNVLSTTKSRIFNSLNELYQQIGAAGTTAVTTTYAYDNDGNQTTVNAPLSRTTATSYDALNRLVQVTDPAGGITKINYDPNSDVSNVTDPNNLVTNYQYDGLGDLLQILSPATGTTVNTFDAAGNLQTAVDARGVGGTYTYDALNRVTQASFGDQTIVYTYDAGTNGKGRLTGASDAVHNMAWQYDPLGRVTGKTQTVAGVALATGYTYNNSQLTSMYTPSGQSVVYGYANGHITSILLNGATVLSNVVYEPFGPARGWTWGNGAAEIRLHDADGNPSQISALESASYSVDSAFRITSISNASNTSLSWNYGYDSRDHLTSGSEGTAAINLTYDPDGNRQSEIGASGPSYIAPSLSFTYNNRGRMASATVDGGVTTYTYNALGQRIEKNGASVTLFSYDETGHLLGEYSGAGALIEETLWLGDIPVATLQPDPAGGIDIYYIHADHLNAPKMITRPYDSAIMWRWDQDPFGTAVPNSNPQGLGAFAYNLRYPGQYYDGETGLNYNYYRDYDPQTGRYIESDPIGLRGGVNTYAYARGNPISLTDPLGLWTLNIGVTISGSLGPFSGSGSGGIVIDGNGNIGTYSTVYVGSGAGGSGSIGVSVGTSNAQTIGDFGGPFAQVSGNVGPVGASAYTGPSDDGQVTGAEITVGAGIGASISGGGSYTIVSPLTNIAPSSSPTSPKACP